MGPGPPASLTLSTLSGTMWLPATLSLLFIPVAAPLVCPLLRLQHWEVKTHLHRLRRPDSTTTTLSSAFPGFHLQSPVQLSHSRIRRPASLWPSRIILTQQQGRGHRHRVENRDAGERAARSARLSLSSKVNWKKVTWAEELSQAPRRPATDSAGCPTRSPSIRGEGLRPLGTAPRGPGLAPAGRPAARPPACPASRYSAAAGCLPEPRPLLEPAARRPTLPTLAAARAAPRYAGRRHSPHEPVHGCAEPAPRSASAPPAAGSKHSMAPARCRK